MESLRAGDSEPRCATRTAAAAQLISQSALQTWPMLGPNCIKKEDKCPRSSIRHVQAVYADWYLVGGSTASPDTPNKSPFRSRTSIFWKPEIYNKDFITTKCTCRGIKVDAVDEEEFGGNPEAWKATPMNDGGTRSTVTVCRRSGYRNTDSINLHFHTKMVRSGRSVAVRTGG